MASSFPISSFIFFFISDHARVCVCVMASLLYDHRFSVSLSWCVVGSVMVCVCVCIVLGSSVGNDDELYTTRTNETKRTKSNSFKSYYISLSGQWEGVISED